ncbi:hypothetical protein HLK59_20900 [Streptomyces sp. S3(2020)]|uniref:hypothetical protein n=1 Tax=Streptomyces sp. S3(2020) TaxID=2732044 RepID=UPI0014876B35|nr:hypothetical protein [Streptomyces sp. S3(2020)]NNN32776.1 hypothetical protein [Streptomyces sp. S3(2020)]
MVGRHPAGSGVAAVVRPGERTTGMRGWVVGATVVALGAGLTACGGDTEDRSGDCADGTYTWSGVTRTQKLIRLADPIVIKKSAASYNARLRSDDTLTYRPAVSPVPDGTTAGEVILALGRHLKVEEPLADPSDREDTRYDTYYGEETGLTKGTYYSWDSLRMVDADFTYTCASGDPVKGHVRSWDTAGTGFLSCADEPRQDTAAHEAAVRSCPVGSRAREEA